MKTLILLLISISTYSQITFTRHEADSIYSKLLELEYLHKENKAINYILTLKDAEIENKDKQLSIFEKSDKKYQEIIHTDNQVIENFEKLYKAERKKKWSYMFKGIIIGGGATFILLSI